MIILAPEQYPVSPFFGGEFPYQNRQKKVGTLILASLLEDLVRVPIPF